MRQSQQKAVKHGTKLAMFHKGNADYLKRVTDHTLSSLGTGNHRPSRGDGGGGRGGVEFPGSETIALPRPWPQDTTGSAKRLPVFRGEIMVSLYISGP